MDICWRSSVFQIFPPTGSHVDEISILFKKNLNLKFQNVKKKLCEDCHREYLEKGWLKKNHNSRRRSVLKFSLPGGPMLTKMKIIVKGQKLKIFKNGKNLSVNIVDGYLSMMPVVWHLFA